MHSRCQLDLAVFLCCSLLSTTLVAVGVSGLKWEVPPGREECFYHPLDQGSTVVVQYQVISGGIRDIDFTVYAPNRDVLHSNLGTTGDNVAFFPSHTGEHRLCFGNKMSTWTEKVVDVHISANTKHSDLPPEDPLELSVWQLRKSIDAIRDGQAHYKARERLQRDLAESTCQWTLMWGLWEAGLVLFLSFVQIIRLKLMFEAGSLHNMRSSLWTKVLQLQRSVSSLANGPGGTRATRSRPLFWG